jgi:hypothetical protein
VINALTMRKTYLLCQSMATVWGSAVAEYNVAGPQPADHHYSPYSEWTLPNRVFLGDTHCHTSCPAGAGMVGTTLGPDAANRVANGETLTSSTGLPVRPGARDRLGHRRAAPLVRVAPADGSRRRDGHER